MLCMAIGLNLTSFWRAFGPALSFCTSVTDRTVDVIALHSRQRADLTMRL
jgi:hypothetical protein